MSSTLLNDYSQKDENIFQNLIYSIDKSISDILQECQARSLKTKVLTLKENIRILSKRLSKYKELLKFKEENIQIMAEYDTQFDEFKKEVI